MNRRTLLKSAGTSFAVVALAPVTLLQVACGDTKQLVKWASLLIGALTDVSPVLTNMGQSAIVALIGRALPIAEKLKKAFQDNDHVSTLQFLDNLINPQTGIIVEIANAVNLMPDDGQKRIVLGVLAIGMLALRLIAAQIGDDVPVEAKSRARAARPSAADAVEKAAASNALEKGFAAVRF